MKLTSVKYLIGNGFKNIWLNKLMSAASIGVLVACMSIIGLAVTISLNVDAALSDLEKENVIMVYFNDRNSALYGSTSTTITDENGSASQKEISEDDYLIHNYEDALEVCYNIGLIDNVDTVQYVSSEAALESVKNAMSKEDAEYFEFLGDDDYGNPLSCGAKVTLVDLEKFSETVEAIEGVTGVDSTYSSQDIAQKITTIKNAIAIVGFWIIAILMIISLVIVSNTIRVTMYNRKLEISIMKAVGATDSFVRLPFMIEGVTIGLVSAGITLTLLYFVYNAVKDTIKSALSLGSIIAFGDFFWLLLLVFAGIGILAGVCSSAFMINKYLRKEGSEFRAL